ncbi:MAG: PIG-L family deacetylase [Anaerolineaceae bacterium]|jgi:LmbE family N-acetylglucosaminyl deacetylase
MRWIYLSPHYDDAVLSCGGLIWEQVNFSHTVEIWTIFSGNPPEGALSDYAREHHQRWGVVDSLIALRRSEDQAACAALGVKPRYFDLPDCIYRRLPGGEALIKSRTNLFSAIHPGETDLIHRITAIVAAQLLPADRLVCPLGVGGHVDHRLVRAAVDALERPVWYYADFPYTILPEFQFQLADWVPPGSARWHHQISQQGLAAWQAGVASYASQISTFWENQDEMRSAIAAYAKTGYGSSLWQLKPAGLGA